jgi:hypothetical protein
MMAWKWHGKMNENDEGYGFRKEIACMRHACGLFLNVKILQKFMKKSSKNDSDDQK